jgi:hypothetical protein
LSGWTEVSNCFLTKPEIEGIPTERKQREDKENPLAVEETDRLLSIDISLSVQSGKTNTHKGGRHLA